MPILIFQKVKKGKKLIHKVNVTQVISRERSSYMSKLEPLYIITLPNQEHVTSLSSPSLLFAIMPNYTQEHTYTLHQLHRDYKRSLRPTPNNYILSLRSAWRDTRGESLSPLVCLHPHSHWLLHDSCGRSCVWKSSRKRPFTYLIY